MTLPGYTSLRSKMNDTLMVLVLIGFVGCASTSQVSETLKYPADISQPFLELEQVIGGAQNAPQGLFSRFLGMILGPESEFILNQPTDMVVDARGRLLIVESESGFISVYSKLENQWVNSDRIRISEVNHPVSIAAGSDKLYVSDLSSGVVHILSYDFEKIRDIDHADMQRPGGLCFDQHGNRLFVADPPANRVFVFSSAGDYVAQIGQQASMSGALQSPMSISVDQVNGDIYVLDGIARKLKHYNREFEFVSSFGEYDQVPGSFAFPKGIALAVDGTLFVCDAAFGNVQMFDPSGALLFFFGETGTNRGQFLMPRSLFIDQDQRLYVADPYNNRIQIFRYFAQ